MWKNMKKCKEIVLPHDLFHIENMIINISQGYVENPGWNVEVFRRSMYYFGLDAETRIPGKIEKIS